jgi:hypothetical protein
MIESGKFYWESTGDVIGPFTNWEQGQPNGGTKENCTAMYYSVNFKWADIVCDYEFKFVCKKAPCS